MENFINSFKSRRANFAKATKLGEKQVSVSTTNVDH